MKPLSTIAGLVATSLLAFILPSASAASSVTAWAQSYGVGDYNPDGTPAPDTIYPSSGNDLATSIAPMPDGGVVICGRLNLPETNANLGQANNNNGLAALVRYAADGTILWQQALRQSNDLPNPGYESQIVATNTVYQVLTDAQGNIFAYLDQTDRPGGGSDHITIVKFTPDGAVVWQNGFLGDKFTDGANPPTIRAAGIYTGGAVSFANSFSLTPDGGVIVGASEYPYDGSGGTFTVPFYAKFNADGSLGVHRPFKNVSQYPGASVTCQSADGSRILMSLANSGTVLLTNAATGEIVAQRTFASDAGVFNYPPDLISRVLPTADGGFVLLGVSIGQYGQGVTLHRVDSSLVPVWEKVYQDITGSNLAPTSDGGYLLTGVTEAPDGNTDVLLLKVDARGNPVFARSIGGPKNEGYNGAQGAQVPPPSAVQTADGGYAFTVSSFSYTTGTLGHPDFWTVKTDANGHVPNFAGTQADVPLSTFQVHDNTQPSAVTSEYDGSYPHNYVGEAAVGTFGVVLENLANNSGINRPNVVVQVAPTPVITSAADLVLAITSSANTVSAGRQVTYTLTLSNNDGPDTASGIKGQFVKPASFTLVSSSNAGAIATDGDTLSFSAPDLARNANETITFTFIANTAGTYTLVAGFTSDSADPSPQNRNGSITTTVQDPAAAGTADLGLTVVDSPDPVIVGRRITYTFTLTNNKAGSVAATNIQATFVKDSKMTLVPSASTPGIAVNGNVLSFSLPDLAAGPTPATYALVFTADSAGIDTIGATVQADQSDPRTSDNSLLETTEAKAGTSAAHAPVITAPAGGVLVAGQPVDYVISTDGTVPVDSITASGLPAGLNIDTATGAIVGTVAADAEARAYSVTFFASNGAGTSSATRTFTVTAPPEGDSVDLAGVLSGLKIQLDPVKQSYKVKGTYTLSNLGDLKGKGLELEIFLSTSPAFSTPVTANDPTLLPLPVTLITNDGAGKPLALPQLALALSKLGQPVTPITIKKLKPAGKNGSSVAAGFKFKVPAAALAQAVAGKYRYVVVVADPGNRIAEVNETNNIVVVDLQTAVVK